MYPVRIHVHHIHVRHSGYLSHMIELVSHDDLAYSVILQSFVYAISKCLCCVKLFMISLFSTEHSLDASHSL